MDLHTIADLCTIAIVISGAFGLAIYWGELKQALRQLVHVVNDHENRLRDVEGKPRVKELITAPGGRRGE